MTEIIIIVAVIAMGGLAYWVFGDPDRSERIFAPLFSISGRYYRIVMVIFWGLQAANSFFKAQFVWGIIGLLLTAYWVLIYVKERAPRRSEQTASSGV